jgi:hypothetical protein
MNKQSELSFKKTEIHFLPNEFQEIVISIEMRLKKEPNNISCVQKLLYLYSVRVFLNKRWVLNIMTLRIKQKSHNIILTKQQA